MAEGDITVYNDFKEKVLSGLHNLANGGDSIKVTLHNGYTPNIDTDQVWADVSATEYGTGDGYTEGGATLANQAVSQDDTGDRGLWNADDVTWSSLGPLSPATPSDAIIWNDTEANDSLICFVELDVTATNGGNYTLQWSDTPAAIISMT